MTWSPTSSRDHSGGGGRRQQVAAGVVLGLDRAGVIGLGGEGGSGVGDRGSHTCTSLFFVMSLTHLYPT